MWVMGGAEWTRRMATISFLMIKAKNKGEKSKGKNGYNATNLEEIIGIKNGYVEMPTSVLAKPLVLFSFSWVEKSKEG
jgi:hypothetical protein